MKASAALLKVRTDTPGSFEEYSAPALPISAQSVLLCRSLLLLIYFSFVKKFGVEKKIVSDKASWVLIFLQYERWKILILRLSHQLM